MFNANKLFEQHIMQNLSIKELISNVILNKITKKIYFQKFLILYYIFYSIFTCNQDTICWEFEFSLTWHIQIKRKFVIAYHRNVWITESSVIHLVVNVFVIKNLFTNIETWKQTNKHKRGMQSGSVEGESNILIIFHTVQCLK